MESHETSFSIPGNTQIKLEQANEQFYGKIPIDVGTSHQQKPTFSSNRSV